MRVGTQVVVETYFLSASNIGALESMVSSGRAVRASQSNLALGRPSESG